MKFKKGPTFAVIALFGIVGYVIWSGPKTNRVPDLNLTLIGEPPASLRQLHANKPLLVVFWATNCVPCVQEIPTMIGLHQKYHVSGLTLVAVAMAHNPPHLVWEFMRNRALPYKVALDVDGNVARAFGGVDATPSLFLIDGTGHVIFAHSGRLQTDALETLIQKQLHSDPA